MDLIGRSGGKPGKQGKNKWEEPERAEEKAVKKNAVPADPQQASEEKSAVHVKSDKAKERKAQNKKAQQDAIAVLNNLVRDPRTGKPKSIYINHDNLIFLETLKSKKNIQYSALINMLIEDFRKKYDGSGVPEEAGEDE